MMGTALNCLSCNGKVIDVRAALYSPSPAVNTLATAVCITRVEAPASLGFPVRQLC